MKLDILVPIMIAAGLLLLFYFQESKMPPRDSGPYVVVSSDAVAN